MMSTGMVDMDVANATTNLLMNIDSSLFNPSAKLTMQ